MKWAKHLFLQVIVEYGMTKVVGHIVILHTCIRSLVCQSARKLGKCFEFFQKSYLLNVFNFFDVVTFQPQGFQSYVLLQALYGMEAFMMQIQDCVEPWMGFCEKKNLSILSDFLSREKNSWAILQNFNSWMIKLTKQPNCQVSNGFFFIKCIHSRIKVSKLLSFLVCQFLSWEKIWKIWENFLFTKSKPWSHIQIVLPAMFLKRGPQESINQLGFPCATQWGEIIFQGVFLFVRAYLFKKYFCKFYTTCATVGIGLQRT